MLNINYGKNKKLLENCKILRDYAILVNKIRKLNMLSIWNYSKVEETIDYRRC